MDFFSSHEADLRAAAPLRTSLNKRARATAPLRASLNKRAQAAASLPPKRLSGGDRVRHDFGTSAILPRRHRLTF